MKSADEWINDGYVIEEGDTIETRRAKRKAMIVAIQADAVREGMLVAAKMVDLQELYSDFSISHTHGARLMAEKIRRATVTGPELPTVVKGASKSQEANPLLVNYCKDGKCYENKPH